jgi:hypothetical protein
VLFVTFKLMKTLFVLKVQDMSYGAFEPYYNGAEGLWCDSNFDWIVYASHESSITIGGWLLPEIQAVWSNWQEHLYGY